MGATSTRTLHGPAAHPRSPGPARRALVACAGPALIVVCVVLALRGFVFADRLSAAHPDILSFWLPRFSFLGRSLAAGQVPLWNPFEMAGYRYAADPQGGWLAITPMALFSALPPAAAMRAFIVVNPMLAGAGLYAFLRIERLGRLTATLGGLSLAMLMSTSEIAIAMPFAGSIAWTTVALVGAVGYRRSTGAPARLAWIAVGAVGWSQVATAHLSHGLVVCTLLVGASLVAGAVDRIRSEGAAPLRVTLETLAFLVSLPLLSLPALIPRIDALRGSSLGAGYDRMGEVLGGLGGAGEAIHANGVWAGWPFSFGVTPGAYAGAAILLGVPLALRARRHRALVWAFGGVLILTWFAMLEAVVTNRVIRGIVLAVPYGDVYLHNPGRMRYVAVIAIPVLGAAGIQGLRDQPLPARRAAVWLAAGGVLWLGVPLAMRAHPGRFLILAPALALAGWALYVLATRRHGRGAWAGAAVAIVLVAELLGSAAWSQASSSADTVRTGLEGGEHPNLIHQPLPLPDVDASAFTSPTTAVPRLRASDAPYLTWAPPAAYFEKGYLFMQTEPDWPGLAAERGTLFGVRDVLGYNPVQLPRYWRYVRARTDLPVFYNAAVIDVPTERDAELLGLRHVLVPSGVPSPLPGTVVERAQGYDLVELDVGYPRVSVVPSWIVAGSPAEAMGRALSDAVDLSTTAVLEQDPGLRQTPGAVPGRAAVRSDHPEEVTIDVRATAGSIVVVRSVFDEGWHATVDGLEAPVLAVDGLVQGVAVPPGDHVVRLTYRDDAVTAGVLAGVAAWGALAGGFAVATITARRRARSRAGREAPDRPAGDVAR